jgi:cobalt/nickel transport system ATP-binding protein
LPSLFQLQNVCFDYDGIPAVRNLSCEISSGERIVLLGANGSGKSTLLRILDALYFPATGSINFSGETLTPTRLRDAAFALGFRRRVGLVFQNPDVQLFNPTVFDEVAFGPLQLDWSRERVLQHVNETLVTMGIAHLKDRPPYRLSGGEKKRVALASIIVLDPEVLLLDEPTSALDPKSQSQFIDLVQSWKNSSKTVITATHQLDIVEDIADRIIVVQDGAAIASGTPREILSNEALLLSANLVHAHRHSHGTLVHSHPHSHRHSHDGSPDDGHTHDHEH